MNIDSALRMIDNEISNFRGQIKMQAGWMLTDSVKGDSLVGGGGGGAEGEEDDYRLMARVPR